MKTLSTLNTIYKSLEPLNMNENAPRSGFFQINSTYTGFIGKHAVRMANAFWKQSLSDNFNEDFQVTIQLKSFELNPYPGSNELLKGDLRNKVIQVVSAEKINTGKTNKFVVDWRLLDMGTKVSQETEDEAENKMLNDLEAAQESEIDILSMINTQLAQNDDVFNAILTLEDNQYEELDYTNDLIFGLLAQDLPDQPEMKNRD